MPLPTIATIFRCLIFYSIFISSFRPGGGDRITSDSPGHDTILQYTYGEEDATGPLRWIDDVSAERNDSYVADRWFTKNHCRTRWFSPIDIRTKKVTSPEIKNLEASAEESDSDDSEIRHLPQSLILVITSPYIDTEQWEFGHPLDAYHGIEVRASHLGVFQILDTFAPIKRGLSKKNDETPLPPHSMFTAYDFHFMSIFYCDLKTAPAYRTMHQIDGKRFPLELLFVFFKKPLDIGMDRNVITMDEGQSSPSLDSNAGIIVAVQGELGEKDNKYLQPLINAAAEFHGNDFGVDDLDYTNTQDIESPWSPTWLLPDTSDYYFYDDGSFPVPPCWRVSRYYVMRERIQISQAQLNVLTNIKSDREKGSNKRMACTYSILQNEIPPGVITLNPLEYEVRRDDRKPRTAAEVKEKEERKKKRDIFRKRLAGQAVNEKLEIGSSQLVTSCWHLIAFSLINLLL